MIIELGSWHSWVRLAKNSNTEVSGASEKPQSRGKLFFSEAQLLNFCSKIDLDRSRLILINLNQSRLES